MNEGLGVLIAIVSSCLGGTAAAITRYLVGNADPLTLALLRWGIGFLCVLPVALVLRVRWPARRDWPAVAGLGFCFFGLFFIFYNIAIGYTTAARASLALSTLPLQTMAVAPQHLNEIQKPLCARHGCSYLRRGIVASATARFWQHLANTTIHEVMETGPAVAKMVR